MLHTNKAAHESKLWEEKY